MGSIGGLDVAYGASLHIVRTNVLYIPAASNTYTKAILKTAHNLANQRLPAAVRPDFTVAATANAGTTGMAATDVLTDDVEQGLLKSSTKVPVGLRQAGTWTSGSSNEYGGMNILGVLNAGATIIGTGSTTASPDLFTEADNPAATDGDETTFAENLHSDVLTAHFDNALSGEAKHANVNSLNLVDFITDLGLTYDVASGTVDDLVDGSESASTAGSTAATLMTKLDGSALISIFSLCQVA